MRTRETLLVVLLATITCAAWYFAGYRAGTAKLDLLVDMGCSFTCNAPVGASGSISLDTRFDGLLLISPACRASRTLSP